MAYLRGNPYVWSDGEQLHLWTDGPDPLLEGMSYKGGASIPERDMDLFAMMRFAELIETGVADRILDDAIATDNFGSASLKKHAAEIRRFIAASGMR